MSRPDHTPVLVGMGTASRHEEDFRQALEPMDLMLEAVQAAGRDSGSAETLRGLQFITVPRGRWTYADPAGEIARIVGAEAATTVLSTPGVLQQSLIGDACARIARGDIHTALVTGSDAGYRLLRAQIAGEEASERTQHGEPDIYLKPKDELRHAVEKRSGLQMPVGLYAILESAFRARKGWAIGEHRDRLAALYAQFSAVAAANPHAWQTGAVTAPAIRDTSARNPMQAFPYTRYHCSTWNVDQAGALLLCSASRAEALGIPRSQWVYPVVSTESNHMVAVSARKDLSQCPGARITGEAALKHAGLRVDEIDLVDLYSCFPVAVELYAEGLGLLPDGRLTLTGGMAFAGGPYNNYFIQSTCRAIELLRAGTGRHALLSCVSGVVTKQAFSLWSTQRPVRPFTHLDFSDEVAVAMPALDVLEDFSGSATVAGYTVLHGRGKTPRGVVLVDTRDGRRAMATTESPTLVEAMESRELVGAGVHICDNELIVID
ncbi:MAG: hypothetical protein JWP29_4447 [Rhodoferax sp.]|nr:hypothetical protein [Rhodoferax sp.]